MMGPRNAPHEARRRKGHAGRAAGAATELQTEPTMTLYSIYQNKKKKMKMKNKKNNWA